MAYRWCNMLEENFSWASKPTTVPTTTPPFQMALSFSIPLTTLHPDCDFATTPSLLLPSGEDMEQGLSVSVAFVQWSRSLIVRQ